MNREQLGWHPEGTSNIYCMEHKPDMPRLWPIFQHFIKYRRQNGDFDYGPIDDGRCAKCGKHLTVEGAC